MKFKLAITFTAAYCCEVQISKKNKILLFLLLFLSVLLSYLYVLNGDFLGDDIDRIVFNPELRTFGEAIFGRLRDRPLLMFIVTLVSKVFGTETIYFRLTSILIQSLVAYQIYIFFQEINENVQSAIKNEVALFCAFGFALHPLNSQAITTAIQVSVLFSGLFGLLSIRYFFRGISSLTDSNLYKSLFYLLIGILFKPNLSFLPLFFLFQHGKIQGGLKSKTLTLSAYVGIILIPAAGYLIGKINNQVASVSPLTYFLIQSEVLFTYFKLMVAPYDLHFLYDFVIPKDPWRSLNWIYVLVHAAIVAFAFFKLPSRLLWTLFLGFYLSFLPESGIFPIEHLAFEHRTYFSLIFFFLFIGSWIVNLKLNDSFKRLAKIIACAICFLFIILNQTRNAEIKTYGLWAHNALLHAKSMEYHNYQFSFVLARTKNFDLIEPIVRSYPGSQPNMGYEVLVDILDFYKFPERKAEYFDKFLSYMPKTQKLALSRYSLLINY